MPLDDRAVAIYSALDSVTLLALLPALQYEAERAKNEADMFERARLVVPPQTAGATRVQGETAVTMPGMVAVIDGVLGGLVVGLALSAFSGMAMSGSIIVGLLVASALMAKVDHWLLGVGFVSAFVLALYMLWKIVRTPGEL